MAHRVIAVAIAPVLGAMIPAVTISTREGGILVSAQNPRVAAIVGSPVVDAIVVDPSVVDPSVVDVPSKLVVSVLVTRGETAPELVAVCVAISIAALISAIGLPVHRAALDLRVAPAPPVFLSLLYALSIAPVVGVPEALSGHKRCTQKPDAQHA